MVFSYLRHIRSKVPTREPFHHIFLIKLGEERVEVMLPIPADDHLDARHQVLQELRVKLLHQCRLFLLRLVNIEDVNQRLWRWII